MCYNIMIISEKKISICYVLNKFNTANIGGTSLTSFEYFLLKNKDLFFNDKTSIINV